MKKIVSLVLLTGMLALMSFGRTQDCNAYANAEVVNALSNGVSGSFALGIVYGTALANCQEANGEGAEILPTIYIKK